MLKLYRINRFVLLAIATTCVALGVCHAAYRTAVAGRATQDVFVHDEAFALGKTALARLNKDARKHQKKTSETLLTLIVDGLNGLSAEDYMRSVATQWNSGEGGVLLLISIRDQKAMIERGRGYNGNISYKVAQKIIETDIMPYIKSGDYETGVVTGHGAVIKAYKKHAEHNWGAIVALIIAFTSMAYGYNQYDGRDRLHISIHLGCDSGIFDFDISDIFG